MKKIIIPASTQFASLEFSNCGGYFVFTQAKGGGRIGGLYYYDQTKDTTIYIQELPAQEFTHPLGDIPQI